MCSDQVRFDEIVTPRYFTDLHGGIRWPPMHEDFDGKWCFGTGDGQKLCFGMVWCKTIGIHPG